MKNLFRDAEGELNTQVVVALIGAMATLSAALIAGIFGLLQLRATSAPPPPTATTAPAATAAPQLIVEIDGPTEAPLNEQTFFTILSDGAVRAEWTIPNFGQGEVNPFSDASQVYVEPKDSSRVGESFTMMVTVYDDSGNRATARHQFEILQGE